VSTSLVVESLVVLPLNVYIPLSSLPVFCVLPFVVLDDVIETVSDWFVDVSVRSVLPLDVSPSV
jgi:hypothetical protein